MFDEELDDKDNYIPARPTMRSARIRGSGDAPPANRRVRHYGDCPPTEGDQVCPGIGKNVEGDMPSTLWDTGANPPGPTDPKGTRYAQK